MNFDYDLIVIGATPGGIACAVRAAREGLRTLLVNRTAHLGGFVTSGAGGWEAPYDGVRAPIYQGVLDDIAEHYRATYGENSPQHRAALPDPASRRHLDRAKCEPRVAELVFEALVAEESNLNVIKGWIPVAFEREGNALQSVTLREFKGEATQLLRAKIFTDATYEGDALALAGAAYRVGREGRGEYGEAHAGRIVTRDLVRGEGEAGWPRAAWNGELAIRWFPHSAEEILDFEGAGEADNHVMAYNFRLILTRDEANRVPVPEPQASDLDPAMPRANRNFVPNLPNDKVAWNGGRLIGPHAAYPEAPWPEREEIEGRYVRAMLASLWQAQNRPIEPGEAAHVEWQERERDFWREWGLPRDEFADNNHVPYEIYVREARRLVGRHVFTENDGLPCSGHERTPIHADSIAITDWPLDSVVCTDLQVEGRPEGAYLLTESSRPAQVPYRCLLPQELENLLVPVCLSSSHVGWGALRLEPVWMHVGEVAGLAAALAVAQNIAPSELQPDVLQRRAVESGVMLAFFNDFDMKTPAAWVPAVQILGTRGFFTSYDARANEPLTRELAQVWARGAQAMRDGTLDANALAREVAQVENAAGESITSREFGALLGFEAEESGTLTRGEACIMIVTQTRDTLGPPVNIAQS